MLEAINSRRSIRKYSDQPVAEEAILKLLEAARLAPSGSNTQPWHFIVVRSQPSRERIAEAANRQKWMLTAPVFIACVADSRCRIPDGAVEFDEGSPLVEVKQIIRDTAIAIEHIVLAAETFGLGSCWVSDFVQADIRPVLGLDPDKYVVAVLTLGYAAEQPAPRPRKALKAITHYEIW